METAAPLALAETLLLVAPDWATAARPQLAGATFTPANCAGELSYDIHPPEAVPLREGLPPAIAEAEGADAQGRRSTIALRAAAGRLTRLEVVPIDPGAALPLPSTLRRLTPVRRGGDVVWLVPADRTIL